LSAEEIDSVRPDPNSLNFSSNPEKCGDFQYMINNALSSVDLTFSPITVNLWSINYNGPYLGLRYIWPNGVSGLVDCTLEFPGNFSCSFPAEMGETNVDFWLNDGSCESQPLAADQSLINWSDEAYVNCTHDFVDQLKENMDQWYFTYDSDNLFTFWVPGITEFEGATVFFMIDDRLEEMLPSSKCNVKEDGLSGMPELGCSIELREKPDLGVTNIITYEDCEILMDLIEITEIDEYLEANTD
jgi:hypothetical protein